MWRGAANVIFPIYWSADIVGSGFDGIVQTNGITHSARGHLDQRYACKDVSQATRRMKSRTSISLLLIPLRCYDEWENVLSAHFLRAGGCDAMDTMF
jgi:hypothetical protein